jgi:hypothetical protein
MNASCSGMTFLRLISPHIAAARVNLIPELFVLVAMSILAAWFGTIHL